MAARPTLDAASAKGHLLAVPIDCGENVPALVEEMKDRQIVPAEQEEEPR